MKFLPFLLCCLLSCSPGPEPFQYGADKCAVCRKTILNTRSGGELITVKGQVLKFHSIECFLKYYKAHEFTHEGYTWIQVIDYDEPGVLINVNDAIFIKQVDFKDWPEGNLIAISKTKYSKINRKTRQGMKGMYWKEVLWEYP